MATLSPATMSPPSSQPAANENRVAVSQAPPDSAAVLAQQVDRAAQDFGLLGALRQQLYVFAIQTSPTMAELHNHAAILRNLSTIEGLSIRLNTMDTHFDLLTQLAHNEYHLGKTQEKMIKKLQRRYIATTKTSYLVLADRTKKFITSKTDQFGLDLYKTDSTVQLVVNDFINKDSYQCRSSFRKLIFAEASGDRLLADATAHICVALGTDISESPPKYIQAHIAQLRLITHEIISEARAAEQAAEARASTSQAAKKKKAPVKRTDTGFWSTINELFQSLTKVHGVDYKNSTGWATWEDEIIAADGERFTGETQFPGEAPLTFMDEEDD